MTTAFVLSGGASLGSIQVGMLQALADAGVVPDLLVGSSVGALNAAWVAADPSPANVERLAQLWRSLNRRDVFPFGPVAGFRGLAGRRSALVSDRGLRRVLREHLGFERLEDALVPLHVVAVDVLAGRDVLLSTGPAADAVAASAAIPGVLPPVLFDGRAYMDGGVVNNTPISHAYALGADVIWVLPAGYACALPKPPVGPLGMALHGLSVLVQHRVATDVAHYEHLVDLRVVPPLCPVAVAPADFTQSGQLIARAHAATSSWLENPAPSCIDQAALLIPHDHDHGSLGKGTVPQIVPSPWQR